MMFSKIVKRRFLGGAARRMGGSRKGHVQYVGHISDVLQNSQEAILGRSGSEDGWK